MAVIKHNGEHRFERALLAPGFYGCTHLGCQAIQRMSKIETLDTVTDGGDRFDATRLHKPALAQEHSQPSVEAARAIEGVSGRYRVLVYQALKAASAGLTDQEICTVTGLDPSTERPRRVELVESGAVVDSLRTRSTRSGRSATVWEVAR